MSLASETLARQQNIFRCSDLKIKSVTASLLNLIQRWLFNAIIEAHEHTPSLQLALLCSHLIMSL